MMLPHANFHSNGKEVAEKDSITKPLKHHISPGSSPFRHLEGIMKKVLVLSVIALFVSTAAFAQGLGLGWDNGGISVRGLMGDLSLQGTIGFSSTSYEADNVDSDTSFDLAGYVAYPILGGGESVMNVFGGVGIGTMTDMDMDIAIRGGLQHDVMVTDNISITGKAGLQIWMNGGITDVDNSGSTTIGTWGTVGIYWWFK
jgi:hypothetical protein